MQYLDAGVKKKTNAKKDIFPPPLFPQIKLLLLCSKLLVNGSNGRDDKTVS